MMLEEAQPEKNQESEKKDVQVEQVIQSNERIVIDDTWFMNTSITTHIINNIIGGKNKWIAQPKC